MPGTAISAFVMLFVTVALFEVASMFFVLAADARPAGAEAPVGPAGQRDRLPGLLTFALGGNHLLAAFADRVAGVPSCWRHPPAGLGEGPALRQVVGTPIHYT
jgi:hypothetical protein